MQDSSKSNAHPVWSDSQYSWDDFRIFGEAARGGSFSNAAKQLRMSQPTVSRRVKGLEERLGVRLFDRFPHGLDLTPEGVKVFEAVQQAEGAFAAVQRDVGGSDKRLEGSVTLCLPEGLATFWIVPRLSELQAMYPKISVELICSLKSADQTAQGADLCIVAQRPTLSDLVAAKLCTLHFVPWASPDYLRRFGTPSTLSDLRNHRLLYHEFYRLMSNHFDEWLSLEQTAREHRYWINSSASLRSAVRNGAGIALLPTYFCEFADGLVPLDLGLNVHTTVWLAYRPQVRELARVRVVIEWFKSLFGSETWPWFGETFERPRMRLAKEETTLGAASAPLAVQHDLAPQAVGNLEAKSGAV